MFDFIVYVFCKLIFLWKPAHEANYVLDLTFRSDPRNVRESYFLVKMRIIKIQNFL